MAGEPGTVNANGERGPLYEVEWNGQDDYLPDAALDRIEQVVIDRLPVGGFDMPSSQARNRTVTATFAFDGITDPFGQQEALEAMAQAATVVRTLHANLVAARAALSQNGGEGPSDAR
jgi:hypothetical protein